MANGEQRADRAACNAVQEENAKYLARTRTNRTVLNSSPRRCRISDRAVEKVQCQCQCWHLRRTLVGGRPWSSPVLCGFYFSSLSLVLSVSGQCTLSQSWSRDVVAVWSGPEVHLSLVTATGKGWRADQARRVYYVCLRVRHPDAADCTRCWIHVHVMLSRSM